MPHSGQETESSSSTVGAPLCARVTSARGITQRGLLKVCAKLPRLVARERDFHSLVSALAGRTIEKRRTSGNLLLHLIAVNGNCISFRCQAYLLQWRILKPIAVPKPLPSHPLNGSIFRVPLKVGIVQAPPIFINLDATITLAVEHIDKAASLGARLIVFGETWFFHYRRRPIDEGPRPSESIGASRSAFRHARPAPPKRRGAIIGPDGS